VQQQGGQQPDPLRRDSQLAHQFDGQIIAPEEGIGSSLKHPKHGHAIFARQCVIGCVEQVAEHMTVLVDPVDPRPCAIQMLPRRTRKTRLHHLRPFAMEEILIFDQHVGKLSSTDREPHRLQQVLDFGLAHPALVVERQDQGCNLGSKLAAVACWKAGQIRPLLTGRVVLLFVELHIVRAYLQILHHHVLVAFEDRVGWQVLLVHLEHDLPIESGSGLVCLRIFRGLDSRRSFSEERSVVGLLAFDFWFPLFPFDPIDLIAELLNDCVPLAQFAREAFHQIHQLYDDLAHSFIFNGVGDQTLLSCPTVYLFPPLFVELLAHFGYPVLTPFALPLLTAGWQKTSLFLHLIDHPSLAYPTFLK